MPTKEELSHEINEALGTEIEWDRLLEEDIRLLHELVEDGDLVEPLLKQYVKEHGKQALDNQIDSWYPGKFARALL